MLLIWTRSGFLLLSLARYTEPKVQITSIVTQENKRAVISAEGAIAHRLSDTSQKQQIYLKTDLSLAPTEILIPNQATDKP